AVVRIAVVERLAEAPLLPLDVAAGAEVLAGARDDEDADAGVVVGVVERAEHLVDGVERHRVHLGGLAHGDARDAAPELAMRTLLVDDLVEDEAVTLHALPLGPDRLHGRPCSTRPGRP